MENDFTIKKIQPTSAKTVKSPASNTVVNNTAVKNSTNTMGRKPVHRKRKKLFITIGSVIGIVIIVFLILAVSIALPARAIYQKAMPLVQTAREAAEAVKLQDLQASQEKINQLASELTDLQSAYQSLSWTRVLPVIGGYYKDGEHGLIAAQEFLTAGQIAVTEIEPYADLLGLSKGETSFVDQPADKRIETAVATFSKVIPKLGEIADHLDVAQQELSQIDPKRYPEKVGDKEVRSQIEKIQSLSADTVDVFVNAQPLLEQIPDLMGMNGEKKYLLLFQNDKELRPTGGFITAYAVLSFDKGKMRVITSDDIYNLDDRQTKTVAAPDEILKYHKGVSKAYLRDSNISPDFAVSVGYFEDLLKSVSNAPKYDGIIAVDTEVLVSTINVLDGDIFVPSYSFNFTTKPDDRCDGCPQVIYELEEYADRPVNYARGQRKDILGQLMYSLMQKALGVSPSIYWGPLTQTLFDDANQKHILVNMKDEETQKAFEALNYAGRIKEYDGDYLHINDTNFASAKANMFVKHYVNQNISVTNDGTVTKTVTIDYKNPSPGSDCNLERGKLCLNAQLNNWLRIYVPEGSKLIEFIGSETEVETKEELGKTVFEGFLTVKPMGSAQATVKYELPFKVSDEYKLLMQKQPGTKGHEYTISLNGKDQEPILLTEDTEVVYDL